MITIIIDSNQLTNHSGPDPIFNALISLTPVVIHPEHFAQKVKELKVKGNRKQGAWRRGSN